jgi:hypothetical protein
MLDRQEVNTDTVPGHTRATSIPERRNSVVRLGP